MGRLTLCACASVRLSITDSLTHTQYYATPRSVCYACYTIQPSVASMNSQINRTRRGTRCNSIMIFALYVVTLFSVLSLHRNIFGDRTLEEADVKVLTNQVRECEGLRWHLYLILACEPARGERRGQK